MGVIQKQFFRCGRLLVTRLLIQLRTDPQLWVFALGGAHTGAHPPKVSGVGAQATDGGESPPRRFGPVHPDSQFADPGANPPELSGVGAQLAFQVWAPRPLIEVRAHPGSFCLWAQAARPLIRERAHRGFQMWAPGH